MNSNNHGFLHSFIGCMVLAFFCLNIQAHAPYPKSKVLTGCSWAPSSTILRLGSGSDNWPVTWANNDSLYGAGGDGSAFNTCGSPTNGYSTIISRIGGHPSQVVSGCNVSCLDCDKDKGKAGRKGSGMLQVNGDLYCYVRNADENGSMSQVYKSSDMGMNWSATNWKWEEFGYCTFLNFGKNYAGARDNFVYVYSHNYRSAYRSAEDMILMRVPKDQIMTKSAYQFFTGMSGNTPGWSSNSADRASVFHHVDGSWPACLRHGIAYNPGLKRYLWWQQVPDYAGGSSTQGGPDTRFEGGFGIYDAQEPWGPWTTVFYTDKWDVGPGDAANFNAKWMSPDGKECYLIFSGDDKFSVRKATFTIGDATNAQIFVPQDKYGAAASSHYKIVLSDDFANSQGKFLFDIRGRAVSQRESGKNGGNRISTFILIGDYSRER